MACRALVDNQRTDRNGGRHAAAICRWREWTMQRLVFCIGLVHRQDFVPEHALYLQRQRRKGVIGHVGLMSVRPFPRTKI